MRLLLWVTLYISHRGHRDARADHVTLLFGSALSGGDAGAHRQRHYAWFLLGLPAHTLNVVLTRAFYSAQDTRTPVSVAIGSVVVNVRRVGGCSSAPWASRAWPWASRSAAGSRRSCCRCILWRRTHAVPLRPIVAGVDRVPRRCAHRCRGRGHRRCGPGVVAGRRRHGPPRRAHPAGRGRPDLPGHVPAVQSADAHPRAVAVRPAGPLGAPSRVTA